MIKSFGKNMGIHNGGSDDWQTSREAVEILLPYVPERSRVLCPFDTAESEYVKVLGEKREVVYSDITGGVDFFDLDKPDVDYIISNPPYSRRTDVLKRLYEWGIPFAMMCNLNGLYDNKIRFELAAKWGGQIMVIYPRVKYSLIGEPKTAPPYMSCYWCYKLLPNDLMFVKMEV